MNQKKAEHVYDLIENTVVDVLKWNKDCILQSDISSGNINYIYRVQNTDTGDSVIFKFADDETRVKPDGYLAPERNAHEAACLQWYAKCEPKFVPKLLYVDKENHFFVMEDIKGGTSLREAFMRNIRHPNIGATLASLIVETSFPLLDIVREDTSVTCLPCWGTESKDLLELTEKLVFEDPYYDKRGKNIYIQENKEIIKEALENDEVLEAVEKVKTKFKTHKQTLIHGDLHTGSMLVRTRRDRICDKQDMEDFTDLFIIDTEFAFYGPLAFDLGNLMAHLFFAQFFNVYTAKNRVESSIRFNQYNEIIESIITFFRICASEKLQNILPEPKSKDKDFIKKYVQDILKETDYYTAIEIIRRVVGSAKVPELTALPKKITRILMERRLIDTALRLLLDKTGDEYSNEVLIQGLPGMF